MMVSSACHSSPISPERVRQWTCSLASRLNRTECSVEHSGIFSGSPSGLPSELAACLNCSDSPKLGEDNILPNRCFVVGIDALE